MHIGENIKFLRTTNGYSQEELAQALGYKSYTTITKWESGVSEPTLKMTNRIANFFNVSVNDLCYTELDSSPEKTDEFFRLKIKDDSMAPSICNGDIVIVRQQDDAETGDIIVATINNNDAMCKRLRKYKDGIELISNNPSCKPLDFPNKAILNDKVKIIGKVVELRRRF